jgi:hypothetical protein
MKRTAENLETPSNLHEQGKKVVSFDNSYDIDGNYRLVEVSPALLESVEAGEELFMMGASDKRDAVIITSDSTFLVKKVETSNTVLLVPPASKEDSDAYNMVLVGNCPNYYELSKIAPRLEVLIDALKKTEYQGKEITTTEKLLTMAEVQGIAMMSKAELAVALQALNAVVIDDYVRLISFTASIEVCKAIIEEMKIGDWDSKNVAEEIVVSSLPSYEPTIIKHCLGIMGSQDGNVWCLEDEKIARQVAHAIFREMKDLGKPYIRVNFLRDWELRVPGTLRPTEASLGGLAISIEANGICSYVYTPVEEMSSTPSAFFKSLFEVKSSLSESEMSPYVEHLARTSQLQREAILVDHTRLVDGMYVKRI